MLTGYKNAKDCPVSFQVFVKTMQPEYIPILMTALVSSCAIWPAIHMKCLVPRDSSSIPLYSSVIGQTTLSARMREAENRQAKTP